MRQLLFVLFVLTTGCAGAGRPRLPMWRTCMDGAPLKILQDPACPRGICGYTCAPDRWRVEGK